MKNKYFFLSRVKVADLNLIFELSNQKTVRKWSFNKSNIDYENHKTWFKNILNKKNFFFWKFINQSKCYGVVRFEKKNKYYNLSYLISEGRRGHNLGSKMIIAALKKIIKKNSKIRIQAKSYIKNISSNKTLIKSGFKLKNKNKNINTYVYTK